MKKIATKESEDVLAMHEFIIMNVLAQLDQAYGMEVFEGVQTSLPRISFGSVYASLERLEWKKYVETEIGDPEPVRGGRARKFYRVTEAGKKVLVATRRAIEVASSTTSAVTELKPSLAGGKRGS